MCARHLLLHKASVQAHLILKAGPELGGEGQEDGGAQLLHSGNAAAGVLEQGLTELPVAT